MMHMQVDRLRDVLAAIEREPCNGELAVIVHHVQHSMQSAAAAEAGLSSTVTPQVLLQALAQATPLAEKVSEMLCTTVLHGHTDLHHVLYRYTLIAYTLPSTS
jgi:hypothetical protein